MFNNGCTDKYIFIELSTLCGRPVLLRIRALLLIRSLNLIDKNWSNLRMRTLVNYQSQLSTNMDVLKCVNWSPGKSSFSFSMLSKKLLIRSCEGLLFRKTMKKPCNNIVYTQILPVFRKPWITSEHWFEVIMSTSPIQPCRWTRILSKFQGNDDSKAADQSDAIAFIFCLDYKLLHHYALWCIFLINITMQEHILKRALYHLIGSSVR